MALSMFDYSISRPYPFRWFTPLVFVGGAIALVLLSFLNLVSTGYYLSVENVVDPNSTVSNEEWLNRWPSYFTSNIKPSCQAEDVQVNTRFFTNQTALTYTLTGIWTTAAGQYLVVSPALTYLNNPIQNCRINNIQIELESEDRLTTQYAWNAWGQSLQAFITCSIQSDGGTTFFNLTSEYDFVPPTAQFPTGHYSTQVGLYSVIGRNQTTKASLWWGESLLSQYWAYLSSEMQTIRGETNNNLRKGTIHFSQPNASNPIQDISDLDFWDIDYRFITNTVVEDERNTFDASGVSVFFPGQHHYRPSVSNLASNNASPNIWLASDSLAKSFYSTIMTDLGQTTATPNILLNETALQYFTKNFTYMQNHTKNAKPGPANDSYETLKDRTGPLNTSAAVIFTKYLCQVPRRKSTGTLFLSILVADLVFMQVLWKILNLCSVAWLTRKDPKANYCPGCLGRTSIALAALDASVHEEETPLKSPVYDMRVHDPQD